MFDTDYIVLWVNEAGFNCLRCHSFAHACKVSLQVRGTIEDIYGNLVTADCTGREY